MAGESNGPGGEAGAVLGAEEGGRLERLDRRDEVREALFASANSIPVFGFAYSSLSMPA